MTSTVLRPYMKSRDSEAVIPITRDEVMRLGRLGCKGADGGGGDGLDDMVGAVSLIDISSGFMRSR